MEILYHVASQIFFFVDKFFKSKRGCPTNFKGKRSHLVSYHHKGTFHYRITPPFFCPRIILFLYDSYLSVSQYLKLPSRCLLKFICNLIKIELKNVKNLLFRTRIKLQITSQHDFIRCHCRTTLRNATISLLSTSHPFNHGNLKGPCTRCVRAVSSSEYALKKKMEHLSHKTYSSVDIWTLITCHIYKEYVLCARFSKILKRILKRTPSLLFGSLITQNISIFQLM